MLLTTTRYFVTGAASFIGKRRAKKLLERKGSTVYFLLRKESVGKIAALREYRGVNAVRAVAMHGDRTGKRLGVRTEDVKTRKGWIVHFYHLAAVYDLIADEKSQIAVNIDGTRNTVEFAKAMDAGCWPGRWSRQHCSDRFRGRCTEPHESQNWNCHTLLASGGPGRLPRRRCAGYLQ